MRPFEISGGHVHDIPSTRILTVDLDAIVLLEHDDATRFWSVSFSNAKTLTLTKAGFESLLAAWNSR